MPAVLAAPQADYARHRPEETTLYEVVRDNVETALRRLGGRAAGLHRGGPPGGFWGKAGLNDLRPEAPCIVQSFERGARLDSPAKPLHLGPPVQ